MSSSPVLHYQQTGEGPVLVILHGLFGSLDNFKSVAAQLDPYFTVIRIDLPGHGLSPSLEQLSISAMANAVSATLRSLSVRSCHLLGHSLGGKVAMTMAGAGADIDANRETIRVNRLSIVDIAPREYPPHHQVILDALHHLDVNSLPDRRTAHSLLQQSIPDANVRAFLLKSLYRMPEGQFNWRFDLTTLRRDYPLLCAAPVILRPIGTPTLFIKGGRSEYVNTHDEHIIQQKFSHVQIKTINGAGHWPHAEKPTAFIALCLAFLRQFNTSIAAGH